MTFNLPINIDSLLRRRTIKTDEDRSWFLVRLIVHPSFSNDGRDPAEQGTIQDKHLEYKDKSKISRDVTLQVYPTS